MSSFNELINGDTPVLVDFFAEWCGPCKMMSPILEKLKTEMKDGVKIIKVDVDKNQPLAAKLNVRGVPTLILYKKGESVWRQSGVVQVDQLKQIIKQYS